MTANLLQMPECVFVLFLGQIKTMETAKKSTGLYWMLFFLSVLGFVLLYIFKGELLTLSLPFVCTYFVKALNIM
jgi:hypothetical protein